MLIYIEGLPYVGKSTLAKGLKSRLGVGWKIMDGQHLTKEELYVLRSGNCGNVILDSFKPYYELAKEYARSAYIPKSVLKGYQAMLPRPTASFYLHAGSDMTLVSRAKTAINAGMDCTKFEKSILHSDNLTFDGFCNHFMESVNTMVVPEYIVTDDLSPLEVLNSVHYSVSKAIEAASEKPKKALLA